MVSIYRNWTILAKNANIGPMSSLCLCLKHKHTPSAIRTTDSRNKLINSVCSRRDTLSLKRLLNNTVDTDVGLKLTKVLEAVNERLGGFLSEPLYCVATMLDARYKDRYFDADKKRGLREMLHTQLDKMETDTVTVRTEEERPRTDRPETSLLDMYDEILVENEMTEQMNNETAQQVL